MAPELLKGLGSPAGSSEAPSRPWDGKLGWFEGTGEELRQGKEKAKLIYPKNSPRNGRCEAWPVPAGNESLVD